MPSLDRALPRRALLRGAALLGGTLALGGPRLAFAADSAALFEAQWPKVTGLLDRYVTARKVPGMIAAFGWGDGPMGSVARGTEGFDDADAVGPNSLFRVYSMTKPVTGMAAMLLVDEGKLHLDQELAEVFPVFRDMRVALDPAKGLESRPALTRITMRHLLTHTSGFGYAAISRNAVGQELLRLGVAPAVISRMQVPGLSPPVPTPGPEEFLRRAASVPLVAEPGTKWRYSMGLDILGLVIQRVSGAKSLAAYLQERLFDPAGMKDSFFQVPAFEEAHLTTNYGVVGGVPVPIDKPKTSAYRDPPAFAFGGAGLVTTPADYDRFLQLLVGGGKRGGRQVLPAAAVAMALSNLLPPGADTRGTMASGAGFGAGGLVGLGEDAGTFGWSGAAGTVGFVNTRIGLRAGLYVQFMPPDTYPIQREFREAAREDALGKLHP
ncbi:MAG: beta-lactamase family protein [Sphingomonadales bacterium]|nr:beta-lactamase family protein [Sphingomonadales bacterium]